MLAAERTSTTDQIHTKGSSTHARISV